MTTNTQFNLLQTKTKRCNTARFVVVPIIIGLAQKSNRYHVTTKNAFIGSILLFLIFVLNGCVSPRFFNSANHMRDVKGEIHFTNGDYRKGFLSITNNGTQQRKQLVSFKNEENDITQYRFDEIAYITIRNNDYYPRVLDEPSIFNVKRTMFVKRLTEKNSRIHLFELEELTSNTSADGSSSSESYSRKYFISKAEDNSMHTLNIEGKRLVPDFDEKASAILSDCATLSQKIREKKEGYYYRQFGYAQLTKVDIWLTLIEEYNQCQ
jgi:hypothetical protein